MLIKLYVSMWLFGLLPVGLLYGTGNLTPIVSVVFGFLCVGVILVGMINVLPAAIGDSLRLRRPKPLSRRVTRAGPESRPIRSSLLASRLSATH
jgi:hypothetical protein